MEINRTIGLLLLLCCMHTILYAQQTRTVKGRVQTLEAGSDKLQSLPSASVVVLQKEDSTFVKGTTSDKNGRFVLKYQPQNRRQYLLKVSFMGMESAYRILSDSLSVNVGVVTLKDDDIQIGEVTITGKLKEVEMKGDTTVINAAAYKTPEGSYLEDLVKRVPGLVYNKKDHSLTYNGQAISEINVNGESFFSGDKKTALENLPANLISKLKVYDKKSKEEEFTGISSGEKKYVLDLQTKDELNKTWLTNATVGYGNNKKKDLEGQVNYFNKNGENLSFMARSTNRYQNSTYKDNINNSVGLNMTRKFGKKFSLTGNVNYDLNRNGNITSMYREQYLTSGNQYSASANEGTSKSRSMNSSLMGEWKVDKRTRIHFNGSFGLSPNENESSNQSASFDAPPNVNHESLFADFESIPKDMKVNRSENRSASENKSNRYNWMIGIMRRLNEKGTTLGLNVTNSDSWGDNESFSLSQTTYFKLKDKNGNDSVLYRNQYIKSPQTNNQWRVGVSFTQPIGKKVHFRAAYNWNTQYERDNRDTYELSSMTNRDSFGDLPAGYEAGYVDSLSNRSHSRSNGHDLNVGFNYSDDTWMFNASLGVTPQKRTIDRKVGKLYADTTMRMIDYQPMIWLSWRKKKMRVSLNYNGRTRQPSLSDLMPLTDNSDPLYITRGNPDLKQMFMHTMHVSFQHPSKGISANLGWQMEKNSVTQVVLYDVQTGGRETYPININGNWNTYGSADWWKRFGHFSLKLSTSGRHSNRVSMINEDRSQQPEKSTTRDTGLNCEMEASYQPTWGGFDFSTSWDYQYSLNSLNDNNTYTRYYNFRFDGYVDFPFGLQLRTDAGYILRSGTNIQKGEDDEIVWNARATWRFLKQRKAELSAYWADILGKRKSYARMATSDGFYESRTQEIKGYFIVTFKYNFRLMM
ncbi:outer membrane beta-barrel protein [Bacteroides sp. M27]|jgi:hypothetical protein|uniref:Outer membrane beta-barrel protein n=2 Tax=Bacteroides TaxID=816 RepID=A0ABR7CC41_9BACE|nr:outer membrane beta-barrel protein [Bacteroides difficilis]MBC5605383.1 outer membrane beta-barrel protein [Bacteroides difficilis]